MFTFSHHPTAISVLDGIKDAYGYLQKSWRTWLPVVGVIAACALVTHELVGSLDISTLYHQDVSTDRVVWNADAWSKLSGAFPARLVDGLLSGIGILASFIVAPYARSGFAAVAEAASAAVTLTGSCLIV
ncbi:MAG TPA: hypothetical protein VF371_10785, partial [Candidatus Limnocylindrales bacterium]